MAKAPLIVVCCTAQPEFLSTIAESLRTSYPALEVRRIESLQAFISEHREREGGTQQALPVGGATRAPAIVKINGHGHPPDLVIVDGRHGALKREGLSALGATIPTIIVAARRARGTWGASGADPSDNITAFPRHSFGLGGGITSHKHVRGKLSSEHREREGEAPWALPMEGATRAPLIDWCRPEDAVGPGLRLLVRHLLERQRLCQELAEAKATLQERSIRDDLTGAHSKRHFLELLTQAEKKSSRYKEEVSLLLIDCDHFKAFNETRGFQTGDRVLTELAVVLQQTVRGIDVVARFDADAFAVLLPEAGNEAAGKIAERIRQAVEHYRSAIDGSAPIPTVSIGIATMDATHRTATQLLEAAQVGLRQAQQQGGDRIVSGNHALPTTAHLRIDTQTLHNLKHEVAQFTTLAKRDYFDGVHRVFGALSLYKRLCQSHAERVAFYAERLASRIGLGEEEQAAVRRGALLHDIGLAVQNEQLMTKETPLTPPERALIEQHPILGVQLLESSAFLRQELTIILHHHERLDGTGYPDRLAGNHIPLYARIVAITEAWDRMVEPQVYRAALPLDRALTELRAHAGTQFDPDLVHTFCQMVAG